MFALNCIFAVLFNFFNFFFLFKGMPSQWESLLKNSKISKEDQAKNPQVSFSSILFYSFLFSLTKIQLHRPCLMSLNFILNKKEKGQKVMHNYLPHLNKKKLDPLDLLLHHPQSQPLSLAQITLFRLL